MAIEGHYQCLTDPFLTPPRMYRKMGSMFGVWSTSTNQRTVTTARPCCSESASRASAAPVSLCLPLCFPLSTSLCLHFSCFSDFLSSPDFSYLFCLSASESILFFQLKVLTVVIKKTLTMLSCVICYWLNSAKEQFSRLLLLSLFNASTHLLSEMICNVIKPLIRFLLNLVLVAPIKGPLCSFWEKIQTFFQWINKLFSAVWI